MGSKPSSFEVYSFVGFNSLPGTALTDSPYFLLLAPEIIDVEKINQKYNTVDLSKECFGLHTPKTSIV
jgi:hypothetical protein